ncbi:MULTISPECIES: hypothetical protein [Auritidibacter]|uniref:Uncharacterized protein n=1 Tax=Auritidibacter ignavus TaxID=678932 RepID=A0AAJ6AHP9_9MICC|nr:MULTISPECIES: hypothetical protein [Auritidibacter]PXA80697.1 hypothetical protein DCC25_05635 [Auritidibacter sp. NML120636]WGH83328.1 hypothetical protein QDX20_08610 [Auritidibacter ignavus]WGH92494.1 hypothetical protein QDX21_09235 [Auritidibacter ignavus]WHS29127.1 hypothetical protein QM395_05275 [Auritidibacter ignavus]
MWSSYEVFKSLYSLVAEVAGEPNPTLEEARGFSLHRELGIAVLYCLGLAVEESLKIPEELLEQASLMFDEEDPDDEDAIEYIVRLRELNQRVA